MTAPAPRRPLVRISARTAEILRRCCPGQRPDDVLDRAMRMLATADGHLRPDGRIKTRGPGRRLPGEGGWP
ncbi:hypothetical protein OG411_29845 [Streptomyces pseudogriseolus]|uniref:hypothetical protein n=1 Tax=Streptomyces pseudogriseolus TaxID=36817 RepID=UPI00324A1791